MKLRKLHVFIIEIVAGIVAGGCATNEPTLKISPIDATGATCASLSSVPFMPVQGMPSDIPSAPPAVTDRSLKPDGLSIRASRIAEIIGVSELVKDIRTLEAQAGQLSDETRQRLQAARHHLSDHLITTFFEINSVEGLVSCEETRTNHVAGALAEQQERRANRREIIAIVGDSLVGILGGAFSLATLGNAAGSADIVGGSVGSVFGLAAAVTGVEHEFRDPHNLLQELWEAPQTPTLFPASVWRFLNWPLGKDAAYRTKRDEIIAEWRADGLIGGPGKTGSRETLLFGKGGTYEIDDLRARSQMLEVLKIQLDVMAQGLSLISREVLSHQHVEHVAIR